MALLKVKNIVESANTRVHDVSSCKVFGFWKLMATHLSNVNIFNQAENVLDSAYPNESAVFTRGSTIFATTSIDRLPGALDLALPTSPTLNFRKPKVMPHSIVDARLTAT